jgi:hypothetical protein
MVWPCGADVPSQTTAERVMLALAPGLTSRQCELGALRYRFISAWQVWCRERPEASAQNRPQTAPELGAAMQGSVDRFLRAVTPARPARATFFCWLAKMRVGSALGLVDSRGTWRRRPTPIDTRLWMQLVRAVRGGRSVRSMDRCLRPVAKREGRLWPSPGTLLKRVRKLRPLLGEAPR